MTTLPQHSPSKEEPSHDGYSYWPLALAGSLTILAVGLLMSLWGGKGGVALLILGGLAVVVCLMGWANGMIRETAAMARSVSSTEDRWLRMGVKLFLISESAIFGALFTHHYYFRWHAAVWPPPGAPELSTQLPAIATLLLMSSSATAQWGLSSLIRGKRALAGWWVLLTMILGAVFLGFQGHEWGFLKAYDKFTLTTGSFGTSFYAMTGFHGLHVTIGLVMLAMVWLRIRLGHFDPQRHFALVAATWYWHFVDVIWIFLFFTMYLF